MIQLDIQLTEHFTLRELCQSKTAAAHKIPNIPLECHIMRLRNVCERALEPARQHFGIPFIVSSGYRCEPVNRLVGGVKNSQHIAGEAVDFVPLAFLQEVWAWMREHVEYDQLLLECIGGKTWIHVSCRIDTRKNRRQALVVRR